MILIKKIGINKDIWIKIAKSKIHHTHEQRPRRQQRHPPREIGQSAPGHVKEVKHENEEDWEPTRAGRVGDGVGNVECGIRLLDANETQTIDLEKHKRHRDERAKTAKQSCDI